RLAASLASALVMPGTSKMIHEPNSISLRVRLNSGRSVTIWTSVPALIVAPLPRSLICSLPRTRVTGCWGAAPPPPNANPPPRGAAPATVAPGAGPPMLGPDVGSDPGARGAAPGAAGPAPPARGAPAPRPPKPPPGPPAPPMFTAPTSPLHSTAFQDCWTLQLESAATLLFSPSYSRM